MKNQIEIQEAPVAVRVENSAQADTTQKEKSENTKIEKAMSQISDKFESF